MTRYRWKTPTRKGRWLATRQEAKEAALKAGEGHRDDWGGPIYLSPLVEIEEDS